MNRPLKFMALAALGLFVFVTAYVAALASYRDELEQLIDKINDRPLLTEQPASFETELLIDMSKSARANPVVGVAANAARKTVLTQDFRTKLDHAFAFTTLGPPVRIEEDHLGRRLFPFELTIYRPVYKIDGTEISWGVHHYQRLPDDEPPAARAESAALFLPGAKAEMGAMLDVRQPDFMNQLPARVLSRNKDIWIVEPIRDLYRAADANGKLTILGRQLEGLRVRVACDIAATMRRRFGYSEVFLFGVRDGARTAEIVNSLCEEHFARVAIDALPVPLELHLAERFLSLTISQIGLLQTVGPFWGKHSWLDFPLTARNPTVYFLTDKDFDAAQVWLQHLPDAHLIQSTDVVFARKIVHFGGAEFLQLDAFLSGEIPDAVPLREMAIRG